MFGKVAARDPLAGWVCGMLVCSVLMTLGTEAAAWHKYLYLAHPLPESDATDNARVVADMWLGNLTGWWKLTVLAAVLLFALWLWSMRSLADGLWPQGQRRHRAWVLFGWLIPVLQLFIPKMFVNDLWAAAQPPTRRRRGNPLLTVWWLLVLASGYWIRKGFHSSLKNAGLMREAGRALWGLMLGDALYIAVALVTITVVRRLSDMLHGALRAVG